MIKINLARRKAGGGGTNTNIGTDAQLEIHDTAASAQKEALIKIVFMVLFVIILMFYENHNVNEFQGELMKQTAKLSELQADLDSKKQQTAGMAEVEKNAQVLEQKLGIMKKLSRVRLREVKALDYIQSVLPEKVWFKQMKFDDTKVTLNGYAVSDDDLNELTRALENSVQFSNVIILQAKDEKLQNGSYKQFEISCTTEVEN